MSRSSRSNPSSGCSRRSCASACAHRWQSGAEYKVILAALRFTVTSSVNAAPRTTLWPHHEAEVRRSAHPEAGPTRRAVVAAARPTPARQPPVGPRDLLGRTRLPTSEGLLGARVGRAWCRPPDGGDVIVLSKNRAGGFALKRPAETDAPSQKLFPASKTRKPDRRCRL